MKPQKARFTFLSTNSHSIFAEKNYLCFVEENWNYSELQGNIKYYVFLFCFYFVGNLEKGETNAENLMKRGLKV